MARRHGDDARGSDIPLFVGKWEGTEEPLCDLTAAVWSRLSLEARAAILLGVCRAAGVSMVPPDGAAIEITRESVMRSDDDRRRRLDFFINVHRWGAVGIEAKTRQAEWHQSGPRKFPLYAAEIARRRGGGQGLMLAWTPERVDTRDLDAGGHDVTVGAFTWRQFAAVCSAIDATPTERALLADLVDAIEDAGVLVQFEEIEMTELMTFDAARDSLARIMESVDAFLRILEREVGLGLEVAEHSTMSEALESGDLRASYFLRPYVCWTPRCVASLSPYADGVALIVDVSAATLYLLFGRRLEPGADVAVGHAARWVERGVPDGLSLFRWFEGDLQLFDGTIEGASALDRTPNRSRSEDIEWRGLCRSLPLDGGTTVLGDSTCEHVRSELRSLAPAGLAFLGGGLPEVPRPPIDLVLSTISRWPDLDEFGEDFPEDEAAASREEPWGWRQERVTDLYLRRHVDTKGRYHGARPRYRKWPDPLTGSGLYRGVDGAMCCGVKLVQPKPPAKKAECAVCGRKYWKKQLVSS